MPYHTNKLIHETSPYLLQHAHNPVNWYPWGDEALQKAKDEDKPILVSIGYSACHWCHVMERESFENEETAAIMNEHFINIKIDREERPDLDHIYMDAVQAMTGSGGWPLNVFLTPDTKPFYGGTYFPPVRAFNRASWKEILIAVSNSFKERRHEIDAQAENMTQHIAQASSFGFAAKEDTQSILFDKRNADTAFKNIMKVADRQWGGFGKAPKFPQTFTIQFLLRYHHVTNLSISSADEQSEALQQACLSLDKMIDGGIYDQAGGGFARYSTDTEWLAPHFEKMLYDNALLVSVLSEAYQLTKKERYREVIDETLGFIQREMLDSSGGFYSALDADSEGEEGKFYVWSYDEAVKILGDDANLFCQYFDITPQGNWEHTNILRIKEPTEDFAIKRNIAVQELKNIISRGKEKLIQERNKRIRPALDDKIILGWNALMNTALSKAYAATGNHTYLDLAVKNMEFLFKNLNVDSKQTFCHTWKNNEAKHPAFLDDYAFLIEALLHLHQITSDIKWLLRARDITSFVTENFSEEETGFFFFTHKNQQDVILRKKEVYDGAVPSGNSLMAYNLLHLSILLDKPEWMQRSADMLAALVKAVVQYPTSFGIWACVLLQWNYPVNEIAVVGKSSAELVKEILKEYIPHKVLMASESGNDQFPLLAGKQPPGNETAIYLCKNFSCRKPVFTVTELLYLASVKNG